jgi:hypothetical protein
MDPAKLPSRELVARGGAGVVGCAVAEDEKREIVATADAALERVALVALVAFAALLPFQAVGLVPLTTFTRFHPADLAAAVGSPAFAWLIWRRRHLVLGHRVLLAWAALGMVRIVAALFTDAPEAEFSSIARTGLSVLVVGGIAALAVDPIARLRLVKALLIGGLVATVVSLVGYAVMIASSRVGDGVNWFVFRGPNPVFQDWPRLSGTFGHSPQHMAEFLVVVLAFVLAGFDPAWSARRRWLRPVALGCVGLALLLTFSWAWVGGLAVVVGWWALASTRTKAWRWAAVAIVLAAAAAGSWVMNVGLPKADADEQASRTVPCGRLDVEHYATLATTRKPWMCRLTATTWPYPALRTLYLDAKATALQLVAEHPWVGTGEVQYADEAQVATRPSDPRLQRWQYDSPHCTYLQVTATSGVFAGLALLWLMVAVWRSRVGPPDAMAGDGRSTHAAWLAVIALLIVGFNIDVLAQRHLWMCLGLVVFASRPRAGTSEPTRAEGATVGATA